MSTRSAERPPPRPEPAARRPAPAILRRLRRATARIGAAVRAAHHGSVPF